MSAHLIIGFMIVHMIRKDPLGDYKKYGPNPNFETDRNRVEYQVWSSVLDCR